MKKLTTLVLLVPTFGFANFTINVDMGNVTNNLGDPIPSNALAVLVVDTTGNGFAQGASLQSSTLALNSIFGGGDDRVIGVFSTSDPFGSASRGFGGSAADLPYTNGISVGDAVAIYFFPNITNTSTQLAGQTYGFFAGIGSGVTNPTFADTNWKVPADGGFTLTAYSPSFVTEANDPGNFDHNPLTDPTNADLQASLLVPPVPEPSTYAAVFGLFVLGLAIKRRSKVS